MRPYLSATTLAGLALLAILAGCGRGPPAQQQALAPGRIAPVAPPSEGPPKDYLRSQQSDAAKQPITLSVC